MIKVNILVQDLAFGGAERVVSELAKDVPKDIELSLSLLKDKISYPINNKLIKLSGDIIAGDNLLLKIIKLIKFSFKYYRYLKDNDISISLSFVAIENIINMFCCYFLHIPCVVSIRSNPTKSDSGLGLFVKQLVIILIRFFKPSVIVNSSDIQKYVIQKSKIDVSKVTMINNPKDFEFIHLQSTESLNNNFFNSSTPVLVTAGRLVNQKGQLHLIRVVNMLLKNGVNCKLVILGEGPLENDLKKLVSALKLEKSIKFLGWQSNPYKFMKNATVFLLPSLSEGQPNALIEALICGCPVVSTDCEYGPSEILQNGKYGLLSKKLNGHIPHPITDPLTDAEVDFYSKVKLLLENPELRKHYSDLTGECVLAFSKENTCDKYYQVLRDVAVIA